MKIIQLIDCDVIRQESLIQNARFLRGENVMETKKFTYYQENCLWVGWLEEYPDYRTQGSTLEELEENLKDIYRDLNSGKISYIRKVGELKVG